MNKRITGSLLCLTLALVLCPLIRPALAEQDQNGGFGTNSPLAVVLQPVLTGLSGPVFVTHAHDGTNRLFIIEQVGRIRVMQPGTSTSTVFLDITTRVLSGGERGLLGLAFHPQYPVNGRFFVYYTRQTDGAIQIAEYHVSANNPNTADTTEIPILSTAHSNFANHNGGMTAFGPDGYLYFGTGDGGSGNDPSPPGPPGGNGQSINALLGKILRIDIDHPNGAVPYSSPPDNPFFGATAGADEIYAFGMRNPWRWSFDRGGTHQLICGDVGQGAWEEIDYITLGANYGWRVWEGFHCTGNDSGLCGATCGTSPYTCPIFEYSHASGRCSITGGYIYRGVRSAVPGGAYIFADYCTGEIWQLNPPLLGGTQTLLIDTALNITSFGEDEAGEVYVVGQGGTMDRLTISPSPPACSYSISPSSLLLPAMSAGASVSVSTAGDCAWLAAANASWVTLATTTGTGNGVISFTLDDNFTGMPRSARINAAGQTFNIVQDSTAAPNCTYSVNPSFQSFGNGVGSGAFNLSTPGRCAWRAVPSDTWITITSPTVGIGAATVTYSVAANLTLKSRIGTISVAGQTFTVKQKP